MKIRIFILLIIFYVSWPLPLIIGEDVHPVIPKQDSPTPQPEEQQGRLFYTDISKRSNDYRAEAPIESSNGRISITLYGSGKNAEDAISYAGNRYATLRKMDIAYLHDADNNGDPDDVSIVIRANRGPTYTLSVGQGQPGKKIAKQLLITMNTAYKEAFP